jgi:hypothetical protein
LQVQIKSHHRARGVQQGKCHRARILNAHFKCPVNAKKFIKNLWNVKFHSSIPETNRCWNCFNMATFSHRIKWRGRPCPCERIWQILELQF